MTEARPRLAVVPLLALAGVKLLTHAVLAGAYGFHRDELYYLVCGRSLAWGFVDHPPLVPLLARAVEELVGPSLPALRLVAGVVGAALVFLTGLTVRELGGRSWAQALGALAVLASPVYLMTNGLFQTVSFDQLAWVVCALLLVVVLRTGRRRLWLAFGAAAGVGLLAKHIILVFGAAVAGALLVSPARRELRSPWLWAGGAVAAALATPGLLWQVAQGWPSLEFLANRGARTAAEFSLGAFLALQPVFVGLTNLPLFVAGLVLLLSRARQELRPLAYVWLGVTAVFAVSGGKPYYPAPLYPALLAAGAVALELRAERRWWRRLRAGLPALVVLGTLPTLWVFLPVVPARTFAAHQDAWPHREFREMFGWHELVEQVARVYHALPEDERRHAVVLTDSYGEAAAVDVFGPRRGLPPAASGHNSYYHWRPPLPPTVVAVAHSRERLDRVFTEVEEVAPVTNALDVRNESSAKRIFVCRGLRGGDPWRHLRAFV